MTDCDSSGSLGETVEYLIECAVACRVDGGGGQAVPWTL